MPIFKVILKRSTQWSHTACLPPQVSAAPRPQAVAPALEACRSLQVEIRAPISRPFPPPIPSTGASLLHRALWRPPGRLLPGLLYQQRALLPEATHLLPGRGAAAGGGDSWRLGAGGQPAQHRGPAGGAGGPRLGQDSAGCNARQEGGGGGLPCQSKCCLLILCGLHLCFFDIDA